MIEKNNKASENKRRFFASFHHAGKGLRYAFIREQNIRIFVIVGILVLLAGYLLNISKTEWLILLLVISVTFVAEIFNTAIEVLCDKVSLKKDARIGAAKDIAATAVLTMSLMAAAVGAVIFLPKILVLF